MSVILAGTIVIGTWIINRCLDKVANDIEDIVKTRRQLQQIRDKEVNDVWKNTTNPDSEMFRQRMQELDDDIQKMLDCLNEYVAVLKRTAEESARVQGEARAGASALKSPTNR